MTTRQDWPRLPARVRTISATGRPGRDTPRQGWQSMRRRAGRFGDTASAESADGCRRSLGAFGFPRPASAHREIFNRTPKSPQVPNAARYVSLPPTMKYQAVLLLGAPGTGKWTQGQLLGQL